MRHSPGFKPIRELKTQKFPNGDGKVHPLPKAKAVRKALTGRPNMSKRAKRKTAVQKRLGSK